MVGYHQTNQKTDTGKTLTRWPVLVDHNNNPSDTLIDKNRKIHDNYICDFTFDDGRLENISLIDKKNLIRNKLQGLC
ncbi:TPA: hypothetical protein R7D44_005486 [Klebsiella pneumoniae]|nr:hypothetical protein [Klebsiella pneumoniae]